jgi:large subunit ribosomal protein L17
MRHQQVHRKFNRTTNQRKALLSGLAINLIEKERIVTTLPKAKEIRPYLERLITKGRNINPVKSFQTIYGMLNNKTATQKIITVLTPRMADRNGGYLRIIKAGFRYGDQAPLAIIEFVDRDMVENA